MWVSTENWQEGRYVAYNLNKIFNDDVNFKNEIYTANLTIAADSAFFAADFDRLLQYRSFTKQIKAHIKEKKIVANDVVEGYKASNPEYYYMYEVLGDYYKSVNNINEAKLYWQQALTKALPKVSERERIENKLKKAENK